MNWAYFGQSLLAVFTFSVLGIICNKTWEFLRREWRDGVR